ncbi:MAG: cyclase family protein [Halodesulfovibrio sp.]
MRCVDCSHPVSPRMPHWPGDPLTRFTPCATLEADGYQLRSFAMSEHAGTHCNALNTFFKEGADIAAMLVSPPVLPVVVADFSDSAAVDALAVFQPEDLLRWEQKHGRVPAGALFCLHTGWGAKWNAPAVFLGLREEPAKGESANGMRFPAFSPEVTRLLVDERNVAGLGIDTHGVDSPADETFAVNRCALGAGRLVLECLANLDALPPVGAVMVIGGLKLEGGTGCPVAVTAFVP